MFVLVLAVAVPSLGTYMLVQTYLVTMLAEFSAASAGLNEVYSALTAGNSIWASSTLLAGGGNATEAGSRRRLGEEDGKIYKGIGLRLNPACGVFSSINLYKGKPCKADGEAFSVTDDGHHHLYQWRCSEEWNEGWRQAKYSEEKEEDQPEQWWASIAPDDGDYPSHFSKAMLMYDGFTGYTTTTNNTSDECVEGQSNLESCFAAESDRIKEKYKNDAFDPANRVYGVGNTTLTIKSYKKTNNNDLDEYCADATYSTLGAKVIGELHADVGKSMKHCFNNFYTQCPGVTYEKDSWVETDLLAIYNNIPARSWIPLDELVTAVLAQYERFEEMQVTEDIDNFANLLQFNLIAYLNDLHPDKRHTMTSSTINFLALLNDVEDLDVSAGVLRDNVLKIQVAHDPRFTDDSTCLLQLGQVVASGTTLYEYLIGAPPVYRR